MYTHIWPILALNSLLKLLTAELSLTISQASRLVPDRAATGLM